MPSYKWFAAFASIMIAMPSAFAGEPSAVLPAEPVDDIASAKELNHKGLVLLDAGDYEGALSFFESSRALVRSYANTRNAALCLDKLGRKREALVMWENVLADYSDIVELDDRQIIEKRIAELRRELAPPPPLVINPPRPPEPDKPQRTPIHEASSTQGKAGVVEARIPSQWSIGIHAGPMKASSLGSDAEVHVARTCETGCPATSGVLTGLRVEYRMPRLVTLEVSGGYLHIGSTFTQTWDYLNYQYSVDVDRSLFGGFIDFGGSVRRPLSAHVDLVGHMAIGGTFTDITNGLAGFVKGKSKEVGYLKLEATHSKISGGFAYFRPEAALEFKLFPYVLSLGVGAIVAISTGSSFGNLGLKTHREACTEPTLAACAPDLTVSTGARSYGAFVAFVPQIGVRYQFE